MSSLGLRFNTILLGGALGCGLLASGCQSHRKGREATTLAVHLETNPDGSDRVQQITVGRSSPFRLDVESKPFLTEAFVVEAALKEGVGGFEIFLRFDRQGSWLLEQYTTGNIGKHLAVFSQFGDARWLASPLITKRIGDGTITFTPDASRAEAERIVRGLQDVAKEVQKHNRL
jgi:SecDF, P1 head subdomain